jgi:TonB-linked SusC/RagA family outer membrane protein
MKKKIYTLKFFVLCKVFLITLFFLFQIQQEVMAQTNTEKIVTGTVTDEAGQPMPGATITLKGDAKNVRTSDENGKFLIKVPSKGAVLLISAIGSVTREIVVPLTNSILTVALKSSIESLNDVVIIGYGNTNRKDLTTAVSSLNMSDFNKAPVKSFDDALGGRIAGVQVVSPDGQPGASSNIVFRGPGSITQDVSPLYIIDGFPLEDSDNNAINPADIESIDFLKDASATAIYGSRGANGVIIITTKRGKLGEPSIVYNAYYGLQKDGQRIPVLSPYEFVKLQAELGASIAEPYLAGAGKTLEDYRDQVGIDWYDKVFQLAPQQNHTLSISGGTEKTKYYISGSIMDQEGIIINTGFRRYQGRIALDQNIGSKIKVGININFSNKKDNGLVANAGGGSTSFMWTVWGYRPVQVDPAINIEELLLDPDIGTGPVRTNPFLQVQNELRENISNVGTSNAYMDINILKNLKLRITGSVDLSGSRRIAFNNSKTRSASSLPGSVLGINGSEYFSSKTTLGNENTLTYNKLIKKHSFTLVGGYSMQTNNVSSYGALASQVPNEILGISGLDEGIPYSIASRESDWGFQSLFTRLMYNFNSKFYLTGSFRADASSKFAPGNKWGYFPAGSVAYRLSQESFIKKMKFITDAKLRFGYGAVGNNRVSDFAYLNTLSFINNAYSFGNDVPTQGVTANGLGNPDLTWETIESSNFGLDLSLFKGRINLTADYYTKITKNLLLDAKLPINTGYASGTKNIGKVSNKGLELTLNTVNIESPKFRWTSNFNIAFNRNKILELTENQEAITTVVNGGTTASYIAKVGQPIGMFYGVIFDGLYQVSDFDLSSNGVYTLKSNVPSNSIASARTSIQPGYVKFRDLNGDGIINNYDFTTIGNPNPDFIGGFSNNFDYKGFDLNLFFQFSYGNEVLNANRLSFEEGRSQMTNQYATYANRWSFENQNSIIPRVQGSLTNYNTSRPIEDASFLRFKTVSLGYTFTKNVISALKLKSARVYVSAQNIFTITNYSGSDPEVSVRNSALTPAFDSSSYPRSSLVVAGVQISL